MPSEEVRQPKTAVVALDSSLLSFRALHSAFEHHKPCDSILLLHIQEPVMPQFGAQWSSMDSAQDRKARLERKEIQSRHIMGRALEQCRLANRHCVPLFRKIPTDLMAGSGVVGNKICAVAEEHKADSLYIGHHGGQNRFARLLVGSVALHCLAHIKGILVVCNEGGMQASFYDRYREMIATDKSHDVPEAPAAAPPAAKV